MSARIDEFCVSCLPTANGDGTYTITIAIGPMPHRLVQATMNALREPVKNAVLQATGGEAGHTRIVPTSSGRQQ